MVAAHHRKWIGDRMTQTTTDQADQRIAKMTDKPPFWRDVRKLSWGFQIAVLSIVLFVLYILYNNVRVNSQNLGIPINFDFLGQPSGFTIPANPLRETQAVKHAFVQGYLNTLRVAVVGLLLSTILGIAVGIGRLSGNWLIRNLTRIYVEIIRNIPLLGIVMFSYLALVLSVLPKTEDSWSLGALFLGNNRGMTVPWITGSMPLFLGLVLVAGIIAWAVRTWRQKTSERTGEPGREMLWSVPIFLLIVFWGAVILGNGLTTPSLEGRKVEGGMTMQPEYFALLVALVLYTASHIGEIVRGSIQAVPKGQNEAASALALSSWQRMRHIVLPQALRVAVPSLGNQYLNLVKNSSLGFVISYFELVKVTSTTIGNRSPAVPAYMLMMCLYLATSLVVSALVNYANRRMQVAS